MRVASALMLSLLFLLGCATTQVKDDTDETAENVPCKRYYDFAFEYLKNGSYDDAIVNFRKAVDCSTDYVEAYIGWAQAHIRKGQVANAESVCVIGEQNVPGEPRLKVAHGAVCVEREDYEDAKRLYVDALSMDSLSFDALFGLGFAYEKTYDTTAAVGYYTKARVLNPEDTALRFRLGTLYIAMGKYDEGLSEVKYVVDTQPEDLEARRTLAESYMDAGRYSDAVREFQTIVEKTPDDITAHLGVGRAYAKLRDYSKAIEAYNQARSLAPESPAPLYYLADLYIAMGRYSSAMDVLKEAINMDVDDKVPFYVLRGDLYFKQKIYEQAIVWYQKAVTDPTYGHYAENQIKRAKARIEKIRLEEEGF